MNNYVKSFLITMGIYSIFFALLVYSFNNNEQFCKEKSNMQQSNRVCISMIEQKKIPSPKKINKVHKTVKIPKKKIVKKIIKPKPKPIEKIVPKEVIVKKEKPIIEKKKDPETFIAQTQPEPVNKEESTSEEHELVEEEAVQAQKEIQKTQIQQQKTQEELQARQDQFMAYLTEKINANKSYPHMARRRVIEGDVKVMFHVFADGSVQHIKLLSGRKIFKRSAFEAIEKSFPIEIDKTLFVFPKEFTVTLAYNLK